MTRRDGGGRIRLVYAHAGAVWTGLLLYLAASLAAQAVCWAAASPATRVGVVVGKTAIAYWWVLTTELVMHPDRPVLRGIPPCWPASPPSPGPIWPWPWRRWRWCSAACPEPVGRMPYFFAAG